MISRTYFVCAVLSGALWRPVFAQAPATIADASRPREKSGYELLVEAGKLISPDYSIYEKIPTAEKLKRERATLARNAPALSLVRQVIAIQKPVDGLPSPFDISNIQDFSFNARMRELARQLSQESDVRLADGDFVGAMNSKLDTMELGALIGRGTLIGGLVGLAVESIGEIDSGKVAPHLDAKACREAVARLERIEARRLPLAQVLRDEQQRSLTDETKLLADFKAETNHKTGDDGGYPSTQDNAQLQVLSPGQLTRDNTRLFDALVQYAALPYSKAAPVLPPKQELNPFTRGHLLWAESGRYRFNWARAIAQHRLLRTALELRARKLESGSYPDSFTTPLDPFSPAQKPLVYKKSGTTYLLYSVGPDGKDDDAGEIQTIEIKEPSGIKIVTSKLQPESFGDIVQAPF